MDDEAAQLLERLDLKEYEATVLAGLLRVGRSTAPNLAEATGVPKARIYGVLDGLSEMGYLKVVPGRPKEYVAHSPETILKRADENRYQEYRSYRDRLDGMREEFLATLKPLYDSDTTGLEPGELFYVVDVGEPSERETRRLYDEAERRLDIVTKSFEYFPEIESAFADAVKRDVAVRVLFLHPRHLSAENREIQRETVERLREEYDVAARFSEERLPLRGTLVDPSMDYESGMATFLVEENEVPLSMRQAAVTKNGSLVAGMMRYFDMIWEYDSVADPE